MVEWLAALPPVVFWLAVALLFVGLVAFLFSLVALDSRHYLPAGRGVMHSMGQRQAEPPQDYGDLVRLVNTLHALDLREPRRQALRDDLLAKLTSVAPSAIRGGHRAGWWSPRD